MLVMVTFLTIIVATKTAIPKFKDLQDPMELITERSELQLVPCINYLVLFKKELIEALINFSSEVNVISPIFIKKLGL